MTDYKLCSIHEVEEDESKEFFVDHNGQDQSLLVVKKDGLLNVYVNSCPHLGIPMNMEPDRFLDMEKNFIMCSTHGALFKIDDGQCVHGPCMGKFLTPVKHEIRGQELFIDKDL